MPPRLSETRNGLDTADDQRMGGPPAAPAASVNAEVSQSLTVKPPRRGACPARRPLTFFIRPCLSLGDRGALSTKGRPIVVKRAVPIARSDGSDYSAPPPPPRGL